MLIGAFESDTERRVFCWTSLSTDDLVRSRKRMLMDSLHSQLKNIAQRFIDTVVETVAARSLADLVAAERPNVERALSRSKRPTTSQQARRPRSLESQSTDGRRRRSTPAEVEEQKDLALRAAKSLEAGFSKADVMKKSGSSINLGRALSLLVAEGKLSKKGDRRTTTYSVR
jgi:hypothetical protein